jgi:hypothetical protein
MDVELGYGVEHEVRRGKNMRGTLFMTQLDDRNVYTNWN